MKGGKRDVGGLINKALDALSREELLNYIGDLSRNWLAIDGTWFQAVEREFGMEKAIELDENQWGVFTVVEAKRIKKRFGIEDGCGIPGLMKALKFRVYANVNEQEIVEVSGNRCVFRMKKCRVQYARAQKHMAEFPCKSVGLVEYENFAKTIDPRIETRCICCPPDEHPAGYYCAWEFMVRDT
ncbi:MAG: DUF6125 family protein [Promethearchaeota archaeon]